MKKILSLAIALLASAVVAQAEVYLSSEFDGSYNPAIWYGGARIKVCPHLPQLRECSIHSVDGKTYKMYSYGLESCAQYPCGAADGAQTEDRKMTGLQYDAVFVDEMVDGDVPWFETPSDISHEKRQDRMPTTEVRAVTLIDCARADLEKHAREHGLSVDEYIKRMVADMEYRNEDKKLFADIP